MVSEKLVVISRRVQPDKIPRNAVVPQLHEAEGRYDNSSNVSGQTGRSFI